MSSEMQAAIRELEYSLELLDGMPTPPNHFEIEPIPNIILYARQIVKLAKAET